MQQSATKHLHYRQYQFTDEAQLSNLLKDFQNCLKTLDPEKRMKLEQDFGPRYLELLLQEIDRNDGCIIVCSHEQKLIGFSACLIVRPSPYDELEYAYEKIGRITELYVAPEYSGQGVGSHLTQTMENILRSKGCKRVELGVYEWNTKAHALYRKLGYIDTFVRLAKNL